MMKHLLVLLATVVAILTPPLKAQQPTHSDQVKPIIYGLVIDTSKSIGPQFQEVIDAAKAIVNNHKPGDRAFIVRFVDSAHIETVQDFTSDKTVLLDTLGTLFTELGQSAVTDAVHISAEAIVKEAKAGRTTTKLGSYYRWR